MGHYFYHKDLKSQLINGVGFAIRFVIAIDVLEGLTPPRYVMADVPTLAQTRRFRYLVFSFSLPWQADANSSRRRPFSS
jgi:hypothetical protein